MIEMAGAEHRALFQVDDATATDLTVRIAGLTLTGGDFDSGGGAVLNNGEDVTIEACVLDLRHLRALGPNVDGLLGLNFLKSYRVSLDFARKVVTFDR